MNSYLDLVKEYGRVHKQKNRITILCIAIAVCLVTSIFGMADMAIRTQIASQIKQNGNYHVMFTDIDESSADLIAARPDVAVSGWMQQLSDSYTINGKLLEIVGSEEPLAKAMGIASVEGRYPRRPDEALLDRQALEQFSVSINEPVTISARDGRQYTFTIVGTYRDFATLKEADGHGLIMTNEGIRQIGRQEIKSRYIVQFKKHSNMRGAIDEIKQVYHLSNKQVSENTVLMGMTGQSRHGYMMELYATAAVLFVLVLTAGVLMIASSFNLNVMERIQFFGMLRCLGASRAQVKKFVLLEGLRFSYKSIPYGLLTGTVLVWILCVFLKFANPAFFSEMPLFGISPISLISGVLVGLLTVILASLSPCKKASRVSPLSAVTGNINQAGIPQEKTAVNTSHTRVDIAMGIHHALAGKKNILLMTGSFAVSIILFLSFSVLVNFMYQAVRPIKPYTPDISIISADNTCSLDTSLLEKIKNNPEVKRVYGRMFAYDVPVAADAGNSVINLISYEENQFGWANKQLVEGNIDQVAKGTDSVLVVYSDDLPWETGDNITLQFPAGVKTVKIAGMLSNSPFDREAGKQTIICSEKVFRELTGAAGYTIIDMQLTRDASDASVEQIRSFTTPEMKVSDQRQGNEEVKAAFYSFAIFIYGFLIIIASITVFNIINSMNTSVSGRINQYGVMRAVGMSGKQLQRMVTAEAATYAVCGCITGCVMGLPLHRWIFNAMITYKWGLEWQIPVTYLGVIIAIAVLTTFLSVIGPSRKLSEMDIVNVVNAQ